MEKEKRRFQFQFVKDYRRMHVHECYDSELGLVLLRFEYLEDLDTETIRYILRDMMCDFDGNS